MGELLVVGEIAWSLWAVLIVVSAIVGWVGSGAIQRQWRQVPADPKVPLINLHAWGQPDLAPPSTSPEAQAEVAELEALWRQSRRRRR
jgi:hypothetical protein